MEKSKIYRNKKNHLSITFYTDEIVRISYNKEDLKTTPALIMNSESVYLERDGDLLESSKLKVRIEEDLKLKIFNKNDVLLSSDKKIDYSNLEVRKERLFETGFYGLGEHFTFMNLLNNELENWNTDVIGVAEVHSAVQKCYHTAINFYIGMNKDFCYGVYLDNTFKTSWNFCKNQDEVSWKAEGGFIDYYFIYADSLADLLGKYSELTGKIPLIPKKILGYQQSRWSYENRDELMFVAKRFRELEIPCDVLYLDIDYMKDFKVFTTDDKKFPEFKRMVSKLKKMGFDLVLIIDPGIKKEEGYDVFDEAEEKNYLLMRNGKSYVGKVWPGDSVFPNFMDERVRDWWGNLHEKFIGMGVAGIWCDMNEPSDMSTETKTIPDDVYYLENGEKIYHPEFHNLYGFYHSKATYDCVKKSGRRPFVLTRSGFAGTQRYAAIWTGDNSSLWQHLEASIPMLLNLSLSGIPFIGSDVGGFMKDSYGELLIRWTQLGAFIPFFRNHTEKYSAHQEPWSFGDECLQICKKFIQLRYSLISHFYNLMYESNQKGLPIIKPLFFHYQDDLETHSINDQFLLGENILVAPITRPQQTIRKVYLPKGKWYDFFTKEIYNGGKYILTKADLGSIPIFVKAGSILIRDEVMNYVGERTNRLKLEIYSGGDCEYLHYCDDGVSLDYEEGKCSLIKYTYIKNQLIQKVLKDDFSIPDLEIVII